MSDIDKKSPIADDAIFIYMFLLAGFMVSISFISYKYQSSIISHWKIFIIPFAKVIVWFAASPPGVFFNAILHTTSIQASSLLHFLINTPASQMSWEFFISANTFIGKYLLIVFVPIVLFQTIKHLRGTAGLSKSSHFFKNSKALLNYAASVDYRTVLDIVNSKAIDDVDYGAAKSGIEFCEHYEIIEKGLEEHELDSINTEQARNTFVSQLGERYFTKEQLIESKVGWVVKLLLNKIPSDEREEKLSFALKTHLYVNTICINLLHCARCFGVAPISLFIKLKEQDRALWYAIASFGRRTVFIEGAGIITQFQYEMALALEQQGMLPQLDQVDAAVLGLSEVLREEFAAKAPSCSLADWGVILTGRKRK